MCWQIEVLMRQIQTSQGNIQSCFLFVSQMASLRYIWLTRELHNGRKKKDKCSFPSRINKYWRRREQKWSSLEIHIQTFYAALVDLATMTFQSAVLVHTDIYTCTILQRTAMKTSHGLSFHRLLFSLYQVWDCHCIPCITCCSFHENKFKQTHTQG